MPLPSAVCCFACLECHHPSCLPDPRLLHRTPYPGPALFDPTSPLSSTRLPHPLPLPQMWPTLWRCSPPSRAWAGWRGCTMHSWRAPRLLWVSSTGRAGALLGLHALCQRMVGGQSCAQTWCLSHPFLLPHLPQACSISTCSTRWRACCSGGSQRGTSRCASAWEEATTGRVRAGVRAWGKAAMGRVHAELAGVLEALGVPQGWPCLFGWLHPAQRKFAALAVLLGQHRLGANAALSLLAGMGAGC